MLISFINPFFIFEKQRIVDVHKIIMFSIMSIFTVSLVWKILREITTAITTGAPGKVKNLGEFY